MRIGIVSEYFDASGGTPTVLQNLVAHFAAHHPDVKLEVIASRGVYRGAGRLPRFEKFAGVRVIRLDTPKSNRDSAALRLLAGLAFTGAVFWRLLRACPYDALLIVTNPPTLPLAIAAIKRLKKKPFVYLIHDLYPDVAVVLGVLDAQSRVARVFGAAQRGWLHAADKVLVLGRDMGEHLEAHYDLPPESIAVVPNWCDPLEVQPLSHSEFRERIGLGGVVALYAGNFGQYQTFAELLDAAALLRDVHPEIHLVLVGGGAQEEYIRRRVHDEKLSNVHVFPMQPSYPDVLCAADIALVTLARGAERAGVPSKFYNILASGRPTVAVVAGKSEVARVLAETGCGVQIDHDDPANLARALIELSVSPAKRAEMGRRARQTLLDHYTLEHVGQKFYAVLEAVVREGRNKTR